MPHPVNNLCTTSPELRVGRSRRPPDLNSRFIWSRPIAYKMEACRSCTWQGSSTAHNPSSSVDPMTWPPFTPPPAIHMVKPYGLWSRPSPFSLMGVRPNSPPHTTKVSSSKPRRLRSLRRPATGKSIDSHILLALVS